jgi:hypothetical protein
VSDCARAREGASATNAITEAKSHRRKRLLA